MLLTLLRITTWVESTVDLDLDNECQENVVFFGGPHLGQRHLQTVCRDRAAQSLALSFLRSATSDSRASNSFPDCRCVSLFSWRCSSHYGFGDTRRFPPPWSETTHRLSIFS